MEIDAGVAALTQIERQNQKIQLADANEAETRRKVIDEIITRVLGWQANDISYEERVSEDRNSEFADYIIRTATTAIVIEAKRAGAAFTIPVNRKTGSLNGFLSHGDIGAAIAQARDYARVKSIPFAVVTNGTAWVVFQAARVDGIPFEEGQAYIFRSLEDAKDRIVEFWDLLSRQRVIEGGLETKFSSKNDASSSNRLVNAVRESTFRMGRNSLYSSIEGAVSVSFTDEAILNDEAALENCYVKSAERIKYDERLNMHLADSKPQLERKVVRPRLGKGDSKALEDSIQKASVNVSQFILVLGPVGAGKTTFLHYTQKISSRALANNGVIWIYIDFKKATKSDNPRDFINKEILSYIENDSIHNLGDWDQTIKHAYKRDIENLKRGPLSPLAKSNSNEFESRIAEIIMKERDEVEPYIEKVLRHASCNKPIYIIVDNVDQLNDEQLCGDIFNETQASARRVSANVIMTLRDSTYLKYKNTPTFDAFQVDAIYIDAPSVLPVLSRRFAYAKRIIGEQKLSLTTEEGHHFNIQDLGGFFDILSKSILEEPCGQMVENLSAGNIRRCLHLVREFLSSAHVSIDRALYDYAQNTRSYIPKHEFFKGAVFGQRKHYREEDSLILNIFDSKVGNKQLQLLRLYVLEKCSKCATSPANKGLNFGELITELFRVGVEKQSVTKIVEDLIGGGIVRTHDGDKLHDGSIVFVTRLGGYTLIELGRDFTYLEACALDCEIYDNNVFTELKSISEDVDGTSGMRRLEARGDRIDRFLKYLEEIETVWLVSCKRYGANLLSDTPLVSQFIRPRAEEYFRQVKESASSSYSKKYHRIINDRNS